MPPIKHEVQTAGYGDPRDGDSWCEACGWKTSDDYFGIEGLAHAAKNNAPYYTWLEEQIDDVKDILVGFYGLVTEDRTPEARLARIARMLDVPEQEWGWMYDAATKADEYWLLKDGKPRLYIGPFDGPDAEEDAHNFRLTQLPNAGFYLTREGPGRIFGISEGAASYIKRNLL